MMRALLLDENIAPRVAEQATRKQPGACIVSLHHWQGGAFLHADDVAILEAAQSEEVVLVTYDLSTIRPVLKEWGEHGRPHGGLVFVDEKSIAQNDYGGQVRALLALWERIKATDMTNVVLFLAHERPGGATGAHMSPF